MLLFRGRPHLHLLPFPMGTCWIIPSFFLFFFFSFLSAGVSVWLPFFVFVGTLSYPFPLFCRLGERWWLGWRVPSSLWIWETGDACRQIASFSPLTYPFHLFFPMEHRDPVFFFAFCCMFAKGGHILPLFFPFLVFSFPFLRMWRSITSLSLFLLLSQRKMPPRPLLSGLSFLFLFPPRSSGEKI